MKKIIFLLMLLVAIIGCNSEHEKIKEKQIEVCREDINSGKEPTQFCLSLLPEYRGTTLDQNQQPTYYPQQQAELPVQQLPTQSQPQVVYQQAPQHQIIQQAPVQDNTIRDMALGGMIGHALGSSSNNAGGAGNNYYSNPATPRVTNNITRNVTVIQRSLTTNPVSAPVSPKKTYMDMSKLSAPIPKSSPAPLAPKRSVMNMSALSSYGRRK